MHLADAFILIYFFDFNHEICHPEIKFWSAFVFMDSNLFAFYFVIHPDGSQTMEFVSESLLMWLSPLIKPQRQFSKTWKMTNWSAWNTILNCNSCLTIGLAFYSLDPSCRELLYKMWGQNPMHIITHNPLFVVWVSLLGVLKGHEKPFVFILWCFLWCHLQSKYVSLFFSQKRSNLDINSDFLPWI